MRKTFYSAFALLLTVTAFAQKPSLTSDKMLPFGSVMNTKYVSQYTTIDTTKGENVTWDFSNLAADPTLGELNVKIVNPANTPYASTFPTANYGYQESGNSTAYRYFSLTSSKMERVGSYRNSTANIYSDPQVEYIFPLTYGASNKDTWANSGSSFGGEYDITCIGYGTLKLPGGATYSKALLVRADVSEVLYSFPVYFWYNADNGAILFQYLVGDNFFVSPLVGYLNSLTGVTTTVSDQTFSDAITYNNPVKEVLNVNLGEGALAAGKYYITNMAGETVLAGDLMSETATEEINCQGLANGLYFITFFDFG